MDDCNSKEQTASCLQGMLEMVWKILTLHCQEENHSSLTAYVKANYKLLTKRRHENQEGSVDKIIKFKGEEPNGKQNHNCGRNEMRNETEVEE